MITIHWQDEVKQEIYPNIKLPAKGNIFILVERGSINFGGFIYILLDPYNTEISKIEIPSLKIGEKWQISFPLTNYLVKGLYTIQVNDLSNNTIFQFPFYIISRKRPTQSFLVHHLMNFTNMNGEIDQIEVETLEVPDNYLLQSKSEVVGGRGTIVHNENILSNNLWGTNQKKLQWFQMIQPAHISIDVIPFYNLPDENYIIKRTIPYKSEIGLETDDPNLQRYDGYRNISYPIKVLNDVLSFVHRNVKYVRQIKERGSAYALKYGKGDCTEFSALTVTLLRSFGIQANLISGFGRTNFNNWINHAFAEVYLYGLWIPIDTVKPPKPYLQLGNRGDLIGLSRINWMNKDNQEIKAKITGKKGIKPPAFNYSRKVSETTSKKLKSAIEIKPRSMNINLKENIFSIVMKNNIVELRNIPKQTENILIIDGNPLFGVVKSILSKVNNFQPYSNNLNPKKKYYLVALNKTSDYLGHSTLVLD